MKLKPVNRKKIIWSIIIFAVAAFVVLSGKYNAAKNKESLENATQAKVYFENGQIGKMNEYLSKITRDSTIKLHPELKDFYQQAQKLKEKSKTESIVILGTYEDKFMEDKATAIINSDETLGKFTSPFVKIKGWVPQIKSLFPMTVEIEFKDHTKISKKIYQDGFFELDIPVSNIKNIERESIIKIYTDKFYIPKRLGIGDDSRLLSLQLNEVSIFDYLDKFKTVNNPVIKGLFDDKWMGRAFDIDIDNSNRKIKGIRIKADVPKELILPASVSVKVGDKTIHEIKIDKAGENTFEIMLPDEERNNDVIQVSIISNKVYSPKELKINEDGRELSLKIQAIELIY